MRQTPTATPEVEHGTPLSAGRSFFEAHPNEVIVMASAPQKPAAENQGEGNRDADRNYREATTKFAHSERGQREIGKAGDVTPGEEKDLRKAEEAGKSHAKERDR
jgi:hypothetical protein